MKISRSDCLYMEIDKIKNHSIQYQTFLKMMRLRYFFNDDVKQNQDKFIKWAKIKDTELLLHSTDRDCFEMECSDIFPNEKHYFIKDYAYFNDPDYQIWVNIDFSLPKEMLIAQIAQLKEDIDANTIEMPRLKGNIDKEKRRFIHSEPSEFAKIIKRNYGDLLFVIDCKALGYKNQEIIYSIFEHREHKNTLSNDTIRKYTSIAKELYTFIEKNQ